MLNKSSASGVSLPIYTQYSQTNNDEWADLTEDFVDFDEYEPNRKVNNRRDMMMRTSEEGRFGIPRSVASNNIGMGLDNRSLISDDFCLMSRHSKSSYSCNSKYRVDRSRSSFNNSRSRSRKIGRQFQSFHNITSRHH